MFEKAGYEIVPSAADLSDEFSSLATACRPTTMVSTESLFALHQAALYVSRHSILGDIVQCGVWRGGSVRMILSALNSLGDSTRDVFLFDTYEGMTKPGEQDVHGRSGVPALKYWASAKDENGSWLAADLEGVRQNVALSGYPEPRVHFIKGDVLKTIPEHAPDEISLLHLDTDWYESTSHELQHLYSRLSPGGVLIIDDYGSWQGARRAMDEFLETSGEPLLLHRIDWSARVAVKPFKNQ